MLHTENGLLTEEGSAEVQISVFISFSRIPILNTVNNCLVNIFFMSKSNFKRVVFELFNFVH